VQIVRNREEEKMIWLRNKKNRLWISLLAGMLCTTLLAGNPEITESLPRKQALTAWWGTLYPGFCFAQRKPGTKLKISFKLAELLK